MEKREFRIALSGIMIALSFVLSFIKLPGLPYGGSVTLFSMVPIVFLGCVFGPAWGLFCGGIYSFMQLLQSTGSNYFAGESAIDNGKSGIAISCEPFGNADRKNSAVELSKRTTNLETCGVENFVGSNDIAELFMIALFNEFKSMIVKKVRSAVERKAENDSGLFVIEFDANLRGANLNVESPEGFCDIAVGIKNFVKND